MTRRGAPTDKPRLSQLDPRAVAEEVAGLVANHVAALLFTLDPGAQWTCPAGAGSSLGFTTALLTDWAQRGTNGEEWTTGMALDGMQAVCEALYSQAGVPGTFGVGELDRPEPDTDDDPMADADPESTIGVVLLAANGRCSIAQGEPVTAAELGALADMTAVSVRALARAGELAIDLDTRPAVVAAKDARRWLAARGVPGFAPAARRKK